MLKLENINKNFNLGKNKVQVLNDINLEIKKGEFVAIIGQSGSGKSTLMNIIGCLDTQSSGKYYIDDKDISKFSSDEKASLRRKKFGFVFQRYNLISNLTALENVELATQIVKNAKDPLEVLKSVGLENRINNFPSQLSGGEQQRVSIARAISKNPKLLLCDEPTGALDYKTGKQILTLLQDLTRNTDTTVVVITHNSAIAPCADRVIEITDAKVKNISINKEPKKISQIEW